MTTTDLAPRRYHLGLGLMALVALGLRLWVWTIQGAPLTILPGGDQEEYYRGAVQLLLRGEYYDQGQWLRPPLTSAFQALAFAIVGIDPARALLAQVALSIGLVFLLADLARRHFASRRAGLAGAAQAALFLPFISYASQPLSETLFLLMVGVALLILTIARGRGLPWRWTLAAGIVWGLAALTRAVGLYALPLLLVWIVYERGRASDLGDEPPAPGRLRVGRPGLMAAATCLLGFVLVVAPWTARNYVVYDQLVLLETNGGVSLWFGTQLEPDERELQFVWNRTLPNSALRQRAALRQAAANIRRQPLTYLGRTRSKTTSLWQLESRLYAGNANMGNTIEKLSYPFALGSDLQYVAILLLALLGIAVARPHERNWAVLGWPLYGTVLTAFTLGHPRLRLPLLIALMVYAALPLAHPRATWRRLRALHSKGYVVLVGGLLAIGLLLYARPLVPFFGGQGWLLASRLGGGEAAIARAIAASPGNFLPHRAYGDWLRARGDDDRARRAYERAAALNPQDLQTRLWLLALARRAGTPPAAFALPTDTDANLTYDWAWHRLPANAPRFDAPEPAPGRARGFYAATTDGECAFRWTLAEAQLRLDNPGADTVVLVLRADRPGVSVAVAYAGQPLGVVQVDATWREYRLPLPAAATPGILTLRTTAPVTDPDQPFPRGVALATAWLDHQGP